MEIRTRMIFTMLASNQNQNKPPPIFRQLTTDNWEYGVLGIMPLCGKP